MKKLMMVLSIGVLSMLLIGSAYAQVNVNQNLTLSVGAVYKMITSGDPAPLNITTGTAGTDALTPATDASTTYSITQNFGSSVKITAKLDAALASGYTLTIDLASAKGTSLGSVDISDANAKDVVTGIAIGADATKAISYSFSALASAGALASTSRTVTLTLTN